MGGHRSMFELPLNFSYKQFKSREEEKVTKRKCICILFRLLSFIVSLGRWDQLSNE